MREEPQVTASDDNIPLAMKAAVMSEPGDIQIQELPVPRLTEDEVLVLRP
ncbi:hypothetical protein J7E73_08550 [Paenibacillus albidus]|nr:hypothetical protein [Paenibacillus albidus]MBT2289181.1 hypothetical protein [Paenibacillus albidus]